MKPEVRQRLFGPVLLFFLVLLTTGGAMADEPSRVVIVPFKIHADRDLSFLREGILDMLTLRLSSQDKAIVVSREETAKLLKQRPQPVNEADARSFGDRLGADYVVFGSLTIFGNSVSLDCKMVDVHQEMPSLAFLKQGNEIDEVMPHISLFAAEAKERVLGRPVAAGPDVETAAPERTATHAQPETVVADESSDQVKVSSLKPAPAAPGSAEPDSTTPDFWKSQAFKYAIKGIALGDVDGDTKTEVVFMDDRHIYVHRLEDKRLLKIEERAGKRSQRFIGVDVADINGNGYAEIFVTSLKGTGQSLDSFVLEWDGHDLKQVSKDSPWYYRVIDMPNQGKVLLGQKRTVKDLFIPGVHRLAWNNGEYGPEERLTLPEGTNIFGFALGDVMNNGQQMIVAFDKDDYIHVFGPSGEEQWMSDERYGGSMNYLEFTSTTDLADKDRVYLPQRIYVHDLDRDGKHEVVVASNQGSLGRLFGSFRMFTSGYVVGLSWNRVEFSMKGQTRKIKGYVSDYAIGDLDSDGRDELVVAQVGKQGKIIKHAISSIAAYHQLIQPSSARQ